MQQITTQIISDKMKEQIKIGDKLTLITLNDFGNTTLTEIRVDLIAEDEIGFIRKCKMWHIKLDSEILILKGHNLGIEVDFVESLERKSKCLFYLGINYNIAGLNRETMIALLKTNINEKFNKWEKIYWFDGSAEEGDPLFGACPISNRDLKCRKQAGENSKKSAGEIKVGEFIYSYQIGYSQFDNLTDMLKCHLIKHEDMNEHRVIGKVVDIIEVSEKGFNSLNYKNKNSLKDKGGAFVENIAEEQDSPHIPVLYTHFTLIRTPSGRAITVNADSHSYMCYTGLLPHYKTSMSTDCKKVDELLYNGEKLSEEKRRKYKKEKARLTAKIEKKYDFFQIVKNKDDKKTPLKNLYLLLKGKFPMVKFTVKKDCCDNCSVIWEDGPTEEKVSYFTQLFEKERWDEITCSSYSTTSLFNERYGEFVFIRIERHISQSALKEELEILNKRMGKKYKMRDYIPQKAETAYNVVYHQAYLKDYR